MKYITFAIPSYNSEDYMARCIDALLPGGEDVEILIINDGSKDRTGEIALDYEKKYPGICKAINKENGGHGSGVNKGIDLATGIYYKVVDSDDWLDKDGYPKLIKKIKEFVDGGNAPDLIISNYLYDHLDEGTHKNIRFDHVFPKDQIFTWNDINHFQIDKNLLMHTLYYKTSVLREVGLRLPEHTFYVDSIFAFGPLAACHSIYYLNEDLYHYYIGRADQSVNTAIMCKRIDQQIRVTEIMSTTVDFKSIEKKYPKLAKYMYQYLRMMYVVCGVHLAIVGDKEAYEKRDRLWKKLKDFDKTLYKKMAYSFAGYTLLPRWCVVPIYNLAKALFKFQ